MKSELINEIRSVGLALAVIGSLVQPAYAQKQTQEIPSVEDKEHYSTSAAPLLAQKGNTSVAKITGIKVNTTAKGIEVILETPNIDALKPVNKSQGSNFIVEIPNTVLSLGKQNSFNQKNPVAGITNVSLTQTNPNTVQLTITGEKGVPKAELFDGDEGLIFEIAAIASTTTSTQQSPTLVKITEVKFNTTKNGLEIILATPEGDKLQVSPKKDGNTFIVDIPTAQLSLPNGDPVSQKQPIAGVSDITVSNFNNNTIRVTVTGTDNTPTVELFDSDEGLIFGVTSTASTTQAETQPTPTTQAETQPTPTTQSENQTQSEEPTASETPIELIVTGEKNSGYFIPEATTAAKIDAPLRDIPASVQVIPKEVIQDRQVVRLNELADNVSGVRPQATYGGLASQGYFIRGFATQFESLRDGVKDAGFLSPRDVANIERVEFLKGPASVLYGSVTSPGGVVNTITKKPLADPFYQLNGTIGSNDFYRGAIDLSGPLLENRAALYRLNVAYENAKSFRDFVDNDSTFIAPMITVKVGERANLTFGYEYQKYDYTFDRGFPSDNKVVFDLPINRFLGEPNLNRGELKSNNFTYSLESEFGYNNNWKFRQGFNVINVSGNTRGVQPRFIRDDGRSVARRYRNVDESQNNLTFQNEISGKFNIGSIRHNVLVGVELSSYKSSSDFYSANIGDLDIFNPVYGTPAPTTLNRSNDEYGADNIAVYFQNLLELTPQIKLLAGGRFDNVDSFSRNLLDDISTENSDSKFSPRVGLVYQPTDSTSIYASWTNSFNPQIFGTTRNNEPFKPETAAQFEVGIKQEFLNKRLSATLAYFDITKKNVLTTDPTDENFQIQTGEQKSRGVELDIVGEILPGWKIIGTYAYTDANISQDNDSSLLNNRLVGIPYNSASLWTTYELQKGNLQGFGLGLGFVYAGEREASLPNNLKIPSYLRTDASIFYKRDNWRAAINFKNLLDTKYYESQGFFIVPAAPLTVLGTVSFDL
ncbi:TonB-dependent siderophore receptor [Dolichospermum sp. UHCC 0259]|uniref:TonB-dependent siderophore receptor n=1 Tax=Dolichospermum sp. UHCC 0259 TaxID=2590010 RepID=UPI001580E3D1|nr:TonB-dependent siderophore receptor [Dolichospermum sp. UHCC 0259]MTJ50257.1 TonB-dependent siderophore receptor [Dolichospermum sp. UHCC 0259]